MCRLFCPVCAVAGCNTPRDILTGDFHIGVSKCDCPFGNGCDTTSQVVKRGLCRNHRNDLNAFADPDELPDNIDWSMDLLARSIIQHHELATTDVPQMGYDNHFNSQHTSFLQNQPQTRNPPENREQGPFIALHWNARTSDRQRFEEVTTAEQATLHERPRVAVYPRVPGGTYSRMDPPPAYDGYQTKSPPSFATIDPYPQTEAPHLQLPLRRAGNTAMLSSVRGDFCYSLGRQPSLRDRPLTGMPNNLSAHLNSACHQPQPRTEMMDLGQRVFIVEVQEEQPAVTQEVIFQGEQMGSHGLQSRTAREERQTDINGPWFSDHEEESPSSQVESMPSPVSDNNSVAETDTQEIPTFIPELLPDFNSVDMSISGQPITPVIHRIGDQEAYYRGGFDHAEGSSRRPKPTFTITDGCRTVGVKLNWKGISVYEHDEKGSHGDPKGKGKGKGK